jgi:protein phosphatase
MASGNATENTSIVFQYHRELRLSASYSVEPGGTIPLQPTLLLLQAGDEVSEPLMTQSVSYWADAGSNWSVDQTILGSSGQERWWTGNATGLVTAAGTLQVTYIHQFLLTMHVAPMGAGSTIPSSGVENWENASSAVNIQAMPTSGFEFSSWSCTGTDCHAGVQNVSQVTIEGPISETASFIPVVIVTIQVVGSNASQFVIVDGVTTAQIPSQISLAPNSAHTIQALSNVSCGVTLLSFNTCVYQFKGWTVNGSTYANPLTVANKPETITATYEKNYFNPPEFILAGVLAVAVLLAFWRRSRRPPKPPPPPGAGPAAPRGLSYRVGFLSDIGKSRSNNEDAILTLECLTTFESKTHAALLSAVADGVGGSQKGEVASRLTLTTLATHATSLLVKSDPKEGTGLLKASVEAANEEVVKYGMAHRESEGLASTLVASLIEQDTGYIANVGDSRGYLVNRGGIKQLTKDHSQVQELVDAGKMSSQDSRHVAGRNIITRAVGASTDVQVDTKVVSLSPGDRVLLCTDGLWEPVSDEEILKVVMQSTDPQVACEKLVSLANERGGKDNISIVIVEMTGPIEPDKR